ncbi:tat pathway signal sequence [Colletotrichum plurivorum]|uniref:Tat pathway signal sequence n=1 Tax=Colletotrichum plurivorum TaxID=2175906 RepID=A0A8H6N5C5_9PEZI|nr:tat pathway signal sequence [Colletotrichum plurivorum]
MRQDMEDAQREASRGFTPFIISWMIAGYEECLQIGGKNSVSRMQYAIESHVRRNRASMFDSAASAMKAVIDRAEDDVHQLQNETIRSINELMKNDYTLALASREDSVRRVEEGFKNRVAVVLKKAERLLN